jgi:hypothetical protein
MLGDATLSLCVSLTASIVALLIGAHIGAWLAIARFPERETIIAPASFLRSWFVSRSPAASRSRTLESAGMIAQTLLGAPTAVAVVHRPSTLGGLRRPASIDSLAAVRSIALGRPRPWLLDQGESQWSAPSSPCRNGARRLCSIEPNFDRNKHLAAWAPFSAGWKAQKETQLRYAVANATR